MLSDTFNLDPASIVRAITSTPRDLFYAENHALLIAMVTVVLAVPPAGTVSLVAATVNV